MQLRNILLPSVVATSLMTLFSYLASNYKRKNFREPNLLGKIEKKQMQVPEPLAQPAGWATHYAVGVVMMLLYELYKKAAPGQKPAVKTIGFGSIAGLGAIIAWKLLFKALPARSWRYHKQFYQQIFVAHLIYALVAAASQKAIKMKAVKTVNRPAPLRLVK